MRITDKDDVRFNLTDEENQHFLEELQKMSIMCGGVEGDVYMDEKGIMISNQKFIDVMVDIFADKMREDGYSEEEIQAYRDNPYFDESEE